MSNSLNISVLPVLDEITGAGFDTANDSLVKIRAEQDDIQGSGHNPLYDNLRNIRTDLTDIRLVVLNFNFVGDFVESIPGNAGVLNDLSAAQVNTEVDSAINTVIPGSPVAGSVNDVLKLIDTGRIDLPAYVLVSDDLIFSNDTEGTESDIAYTKRKEIFCPVNGTLRVKFDIKINNGGNNSFGKIYKNGIAHGTEQLNNTAAYVTYSEDLVFAAGDRIELWCYRAGGTTYSYRNLRVYGIIYERFENILT